MAVTASLGRRAYVSGQAGKTSETLIAKAGASLANSQQILTNRAASLALNQGAVRNDKLADPRRDPPWREWECVMAKNRKAPSLGKAIVDLWRNVTSGMFDTYHPEQHYMRGPGPKWRAKHHGAHGEPDLAGMANVSA